MSSSKAGRLMKKSAEQGQPKPEPIHEEVEPRKSDYTSLPAVEMMKHLLGGYDRGILTAGEVEFRVLGALLKSHMAYVRKGEESGMGTSWCGNEPPPPVWALLEFDVARIYFYPIDEKLVEAAMGPV